MTIAVDVLFQPTIAGASHPQHHHHNHYRHCHHVSTSTEGPQVKVVALKRGKTVSVMLPAFVSGRSMSASWSKFTNASKSKSANASKNKSAKARRQQHQQQRKQTNKEKHKQTHEYMKKKERSMTHGEYSDKEQVNIETQTRITKQADRQTNK